MPPPPKSIFLSNRDLLSSTFLTFLLDINFDLERFFDIFRHFSALLSSTFSNFELGIVILSLVPRFLKKTKTHLLSANKKPKQQLVVRRNQSLKRFPREKIKITITIGPKFEKILENKAEKCRNISKLLNTHLFSA